MTEKKLIKLKNYISTRNCKDLERTAMCKVSPKK